MTFTATGDLVFRRAFPKAIFAHPTDIPDKVGQTAVALLGKRRTSAAIKAANGYTFLIRCHLLTPNCLCGCLFCTRWTIFRPSIQLNFQVPFLCKKPNNIHGKTRYFNPPPKPWMAGKQHFRIENLHKRRKMNPGAASDGRGKGPPRLLRFDDSQV